MKRRFIVCALTIGMMLMMIPQNFIYAVSNTEVEVTSTEIHAENVKADVSYIGKKADTGVQEATLAASAPTDPTFFTFDTANPGMQHRCYPPQEHQPMSCMERKPYMAVRDRC